MKLSKYQKYLLLTLLITIAIVGFYTIQYSLSSRSAPSALIYSVLFTALVSISIILVNFPIFKYIKINYPLNQGFIKSLLLGFVFTSITAALIISFWVFIFYYTVNQYCEVEEIKKYGLSYVLYNNIVIAVIVNLFVGGYTVIRYSVQEWKKALIEAEKFKRQSIESQYATLVNQINPHFLFNSLNALVSLIPQSPEKAIEFVNRFSKIYRYVLDAKDKIVCDIKDEIEFMDSYCFLQKIRFADSLQVEKKIETECMDGFLPPLSLQLLVENAIKHNEISKASPLKIIIYTKEYSIYIENNLKLKAENNESIGIGLKNLAERYEHLTDEKPEFYIQDEVYIARLPIIFEN